MRQQRVPRTGRVARVARWLWPDHNPLRRACDRAEAGIVALLVGAFLIGAPAIALITWWLTLNSSFTTADAVHHGWRQVSAVQQADEPDWIDGYASPVPVRWTAPGGVQHTGQFLASPGARAGTRITAWSNASGHLTETPMSPRQALTQAALAAAFAVPIWALTLLCAGMLCHHIVDRRRLSAWEADWRTSNLSDPAGASPGRKRPVLEAVSGDNESPRAGERFHPAEPEVPPYGPFRPCRLLAVQRCNGTQHWSEGTWEPPARSSAGLRYAPRLEES